MPAIITHNLFAQEALAQLPEELVATQEETLAFLLGNQGPDPFFSRFSTDPGHAHTCHALAHQMHDGRCADALLAIRESVSHLPSEDEAVGRAFALGLLGHYLLDSRAHAFIFGQEYDLCGAGTGLDDALSEVHGLIESDIDVWMLWHMRHETIADAPATQCLARTDRVTRVAGSLFAQVSLQVFGIFLHPDEYAAACRDYAAVYHVIDPAGAPLQRLATSIELLGRAHSQARAMAHPITRDPDGASLNLEHQLWRDPYTQALHEDSFPDLFWAAHDEWDGLSRAFCAGDTALVRRLMGARNYNGEPQEADAQDA